MAPTENINICKQNTDDKYAHKKFQVQRIYAHKKFGACLSSTPPKTINKRKNSSPFMETKTGVANLGQTRINNTTTKCSTADIFRPYALPDKTSRKRKYHELQNESSGENFAMDYKRFAYATGTTTTQPPSAPSLPSYSTSTDSYLINPLSTLLYNPFYRLQQYQFNPQIFTVILQKQREALYMGEILKRQINLNLYNLIGQ